MKHLILQLEGDLFQSAYSVYVVDINHKKEGRFFYIGQTGDSHYLMARSPFYRMGGHFEYRASTQNQIFKGIGNYLDVELEGPENELENEKEERTRRVRAAIEAFLVECTVTYHIFPVAPFSYENEDKELHKRNRHKTLLIETALLKQFNKVFKEKLLNKGLVSLARKPTTEEIELVGQITAKLSDSNNDKNYIQIKGIR